MTGFDSKPATPLFGFSADPPPWARAVLGIALIVAGLVVLSDVAMATILSAKFIAAIAVAGGAIEIVHAFWTKGWGGFAWQIVLGVIYVCFGIALWNQPVAGALFITWVLGLLLLISGVMRTFIGFSRWQDAGWVMLLSGVFGILAGLVVLTGFPMTGLWVIGFVLGIDLLSHGIAWLTYVWLPGKRAA